MPEKRYIDANKAKKYLRALSAAGEYKGVLHLIVPYNLIDDVPTENVAPIVRCINCIHCEPLEKNCELNSSAYRHCALWRGEEAKYVWHKYKKYTRDYSIVDVDDFCSYGERKDDE